MELFTLQVCHILNDILSEFKTNPNKPFFEAAPNQYLHTCLAPFKTNQCELFTIQHRKINRQMCNNCDGEAKKKVIRLKRRKKTKVAAGESATLPSSTVILSSLSPPSLIRRFHLVKNQQKSNKITIKNYKVRLEKVKKEQSISFEKSQIPAVLDRVLAARE